MSGGRARTDNPPGLDRLSFRVGTLETFLAEMLRRLPLQEIPDGRFAGTRPLARVDPQPRSNWIFGLLDAWAAVGDVIGFYQERIANEGFLRTAVEELSVFELIRLLGYPPRPGVAADTHLAFTAAAGKEMPAVVAVPRGAIIQSVPAGGQLPQTWETAEALGARAQWNRIRPAIATRWVQPPILGGATAVQLAGARTRIKKGAALVLTGVLAGAGPRRYLRLVDKAEVETPGARRPARTVARWKAPLDPGRPKAELATPAAFLLHQQTQLFGYNATPWQKLPLAQKRAQRQILGGVLRSEDGGDAWTETTAGLPAAPVHALLQAAGAGLLAATQKGVFRLDGDQWQALEEGLGTADVRSLAESRDGHLFAGTSDGRLLRSTDGGDTWEPLTAARPPRLLARLARFLLAPARKLWKRLLVPRLTRLPKTTLESLLIRPARGASRVFAGTDKGVFAIETQGDGWLTCNQGFPGTDPKTGIASLPIHALAEADAFYAGTDKGAFRSRDPRAGWEKASDGLPEVDPKTGLAKTKVLSLLAFTERRSRRRELFAGTDRGVFRRGAGGRFEPVNVGLPGAGPRARTAAVKVVALAVADDPTTLATELYAGTDRGLFRSRDLGASWLAVDLGAKVPTSVTALAAGGALAVAVPFDGFVKEEWPGFRIRPGQIDLSKDARGVVPGGWIALSQGDGQDPPDLILRILDVATVRRADFGLTALVSRLMVRPDPRLADFDLRQTVARFESETLALYRREEPVIEPLDPRAFFLDAHPPRSSGQPPLDEPLPVQRPLIVAGRPIRARVAPAAYPLALETEDGGTRPLRPADGDSYPVLAPPVVSGAELTLAVLAADGTRGSVRVAAAQVTWLPAEDGDPIAGEVTYVAGFEPAGTGPGHPDPLLSVSPALSLALDPATVAVYANVARATQGETGRQVLGSGDAAKAYQSFTLNKTPLTYLPAANAAGMRSTLEVRVDGVLWREVFSFVDAGPRDRVYIVRRDLDGTPAVTFGDGIRGARLPTGTHNVVAVYRSGVWAAPVPAHHLSLPRTRPLGLRTVDNPLPAPGGTPPESLSEARRQAPTSSRCLGRIVSRSDYRDFALAFPGISRARRADLVTDAGLILQITVAGIDGRAVEPAGNVYRQLVAAIDAVRMPGPPVSVNSYRPVRFRLRARLRTDPADPPSTVEERVRAALLERYSFHRSRFGEMISASEITTLIQEVPGVVDVVLEAFYRSGAAPALRPSLRAHPARYSRSRREIVPAELLRIDESGIDLELATS